MAILKVERLNKSYGDLQVLKDFSFEVNKGEVVSIIGPSGSGKSTILRCLNCLEIPDSGIVTFEGQSFDFSKIQGKQVRDIRKYTSMVFQSYNLFRNKTALDNVSEYLVKVKGMNRKAGRQEATKYLSLVGLEDKLTSYPYQLSGGQQQRVGIARALAMQPQVMLLDEPTSALDLELIKSVLKTIQEIADQGQTMIIVTHEINFARQISDKVIFLEKGELLAEGSAHEILDNPDKQRIQEFLNLIDI